MVDARLDRKKIVILARAVQVLQSDFQAGDIAVVTVSSTANEVLYFEYARSIATDDRFSCDMVCVFLKIPCK